MTGPCTCWWCSGGLGFHATPGWTVCLSCGAQIQVTAEQVWADRSGRVTCSDESGMALHDPGRMHVPAEEGE